MQLLRLNQAMDRYQQKSDQDSDLNKKQAERHEPCFFFPRPRGNRKQDHNQAHLLDSGEVKKVTDILSVWQNQADAIPDNIFFNHRIDQGRSDREQVIPNVIAEEDKRWKGFKFNLKIFPDQLKKKHHQEKNPHLEDQGKVPVPDLYRYSVEEIFGHSSKIRKSIKTSWCVCDNKELNLCIRNSPDDNSRLSRKL